MVVMLAMSCVPVAPLAQTFTATSGMPVRIEIAASCLVTASDLDFGAYNAATGAPTRGQTTIQLLCAPGLGAELALDAGSAAGATTMSRKLNSESSADRLDYGLFQDAARSVHWGDTTGTDTMEVLTTGAPQLVPVYGEIPAGQRTQPGTYSDVITVRVQF